MTVLLLSSTQIVCWIVVMFFIPLLEEVRGGLSFAQGERKHIRKGNEQYKENQYQDAEISYHKALEENTRSYEGAFNLGDAFYKGGKYEDAANRFEMLTHQESDKNTTAKSYHNLGNSLLQSKKYEESIKAYKNALRNNPGDLDTKYNLAYAQAKLKQQQQQQKQDQNQENKEQDQKEQDNKKEQNKGEEKEQEQTQQKEQQQQPRPDQISKKDAERLLDAINNEEKDVQEKLKKKKARVTKIKIEKDW